MEDVNFRYSERFRLHKDRDNTKQVPNFDKDFEDLLGMDPNYRRRRNSSFGFRETGSAIGGEIFSNQLKDSRSANSSRIMRNPSIERRRNENQNDVSSSLQSRDRLGPLQLGLPVRTELTASKDSFNGQIDGEKCVEIPDRSPVSLDISGSIDTQISVKDNGGKVRGDIKKPSAPVSGRSSRSSLKSAPRPTQGSSDLRSSTEDIPIGSVLDRDLLKKIKELNECFFLFSREPSEKELTELKELKSGAKCFICKDREMLKELDPRRTVANLLDKDRILYRSDDTCLLDVGNRSLTDAFQTLVTAVRKDLEEEKRKFCNLKLGSVIKSKEALNSLIESQRCFFVLNKLPLHEEREKFNDLPGNIGFFVVPCDDNKFYGPEFGKDFNTGFYNDKKKIVIDCTNANLNDVIEKYFAKEEVTVNNGDILTLVEQLEKVTNANTDFVILDHEPTGSERELLNQQEIPFFVISNKKLLRRLDPNAIIKANGIYRHVDGSVHNLPEFTEKAFKDILKNPIEQVESDGRELGNVKCGSVIRNADQYKAIKDTGKDFIILSQIPYKDESLLLQTLKPNIPYFIVPDRSILKDVDLLSVNVHYKASSKKFTAFPAQLTKENIMKFLNEMYSRYANKEGISGVKYGTVLDKASVAKVASSRKGFLLFDHVPTNEELSALGGLPDEVGFFVITDKKLSESVFGRSQDSSVTLFVPATGQLIDIKGDVTKEVISDLVKGNLLKESYLAKETREFCGIKFGSVISRESEVSSLLNSGKSFFLLDKPPNEKEITLFSNLPNDVGFFVMATPSIKSKFDPNCESKVKNGLFINVDRKCVPMEAVDEKNVMKMLEILSSSVTRRMIAGVASGSILVNKADVSCVMRSKCNFFVIDRDLSVNELKEFESLPKDVGYVIIKDRELLYMYQKNLSSEGALYHVADKGYLVDYDGKFIKKELEEFVNIKPLYLQSNESRHIEGVKYGSIVRSEAEFNLLLSSNKSFFMLDFEPNEYQRMAFDYLPENVGFFVLSADIIKERLKLGDSSKSRIMFYDSINSQVMGLRDRITRESVKNFLSKLGDARFMNGIQCGSVINEEQYLDLLSKGFNFLIYKEIMPSQMEDLKRLPRDVGYFIADKNLCNKFARNCSLCSKKFTEPKSFEPEDSDIVKFVEISLPSEKRKINGNPYGSILDLSKLRQIMATGKSFFLIDHEASSEEVEAFKHLPKDIGYFVAPEGLLPESDSMGGTSFFSSIEHSLRSVGRKIVSKELLMKFLEEDAMRETCGIHWGSTIKDNDIFKLLESGCRFLLLDHVPTAQERASLGSLPDAVGFFLHPNSELVPPTGAVFVTEDGVIHGISKIDDINTIISRGRETRNFEGRKWGASADENLVQRLMNLNVPFILFRGAPTLEELGSIPQNIPFFVLSSKDLISRYFEDKTNRLIVFNMLGQGTEVDSVEKEKVEIALKCDTKFLCGIKYGTEIQDKKQIENLINSGMPFYVLKGDISDKLMKQLEELPDEIGYFVIKDMKLLSVLDSNVNLENSSNLLFYDCSQLLEYNKDQTIREFAENNDPTAIKGIKIGSNIETEEQLKKLIDAHVQFLVLTHEPNEDELGILAEVPEEFAFFVISNKKLLDVLSGGASVGSYVACYNPDKGNLIEFHEEMTPANLQLFIDKNKTLFIDGIQNGSTLENVNQLNTILNSKKPFFILKDNINEEQRNCFEGLKDYAAFFVIKDPKLVSIIDEKYEHVHNVAYYEPNRYKIIPYNANIDPEGLYSFILDNEPREIFGIKCGQEIEDESQLDAILQANVKFFVLGRKPKPEELETLEALPDNVGFFVIRDKKMIKKIDPDHETKTGIMYYDPLLQKLCDFEKDVKPSTMTTYLVEKCIKRIGGITSGSEIESEQEIQKLIKSRRPFFILNRDATDSEIDTFSSLPDEVGFFVISDRKLINSIDPNYKGTSSVGYYNPITGRIIDFVGDINDDTVAKCIMSANDVREVNGIKYGAVINKENIQTLLNSSVSFFLLENEPNNVELYNLSDLPPDVAFFVLKDHKLLELLDKTFEKKTKNIFYRHKDSTLHNFSDSINDEDVLVFLMNMMRDVPTKTGLVSIRESGGSGLPTTEDMNNLSGKNDKLSLQQLSHEAAQFFEAIIDDENREIPDINIEELFSDEGEIEEFLSNDDHENEQEDDGGKITFDDVFNDFESDLSSSGQADEHSRKKSRIPVLKRQREGASEDEELEDENSSDENDDEEMNEFLEDDIFGQSVIPDDAPRDAFGFPTTKPAKKKRCIHLRSLRAIANEVKRRFINVSKKAHSRFPTIQNRRIAIIRLIDSLRLLAEFRYINRRLRALERVNTQMRLHPNATYTTMIRIREGKRLFLSLRSANKRIERLRCATATNEKGQTIYSLENELEKVRVRQLVKISKQKKEVESIQEEISKLQSDLVTLDGRIRLMTQKESNYQDYFKKRKETESQDKPEQEKKKPKEPEVPKSGRPFSSRSKQSKS